MNPADWTLCAVYFAGSGGLSPVQLQKSLFLLGEQMRQDVGTDFYHFDAYNYGPFCKTIYEDAERLATAGLIMMNEVRGQRWNRFVISPAGVRRSEDLIRQAPAKAITHLKAVVEWALHLSFAALVRAVYDRYPAYRANSVFQVKKNLENVKRVVS